MEAEFYYSGLYSCPVLVARTGAPWRAPTGPEAYGVLKDLRPVGIHPLNDVWEGNLAPKLHALLDSMKVKWTSTDIARIGNVRESFAPVILWIGVMPASLSGDDGYVVASKCRELLVEYDITDVDVEIRESIVTRLVGPKLLTPANYFDGTADVRDPLTTALGSPICAQPTPWAEGTGGFFIAEGGNTERILLVTARHVVFPPNENQNMHFKRDDNNHPRHNVTLFNDASFKNYLESIKTEIGHKALTVGHIEKLIEYIEGDFKAVAGEDTRNEEQRRAQYELESTRRAIEKLCSFYEDVSARWATPESRVLGHVMLSPPINAGAGSSGEGYTEDWAVIEIEPSKVDASNFDGNAIDLGTRIPVDKITKMITQTTYPDTEDVRSFEYPCDRLLRLKDTIPDDEMRHPLTLNENGDPCLMVIKRGNTTGLTIGRANNVFSYARIYNSDGSVETSKEWPILPFDSKSGAFSGKGDSGSVIVDGLGRFGGLLTSGAGSTRDSDITYATPISFVLKRMQENGLHPTSTRL